MEIQLVDRVTPAGVINEDRLGLDVIQAKR